MKKYKQSIIISFLIALVISLTLPIDYSNAQQVNKLLAPPGGGSGTTTVNSSSDNTALYVIGGAVIVGAIIYAVLLNKKNKDKEQKGKDTTTALIDADFLESNLTFNEMVSNIQSQIPINISFGLQNDLVMREQKRYFVELNYNF